MLRSSLVVVGLTAALAGPASAQSLGTFRWQMQPHCNVLSLVVTQTAGVYRLEGTDDQCGDGRDQASVTGLAFLNPDGAIGLGLTIVTAPGGTPVHVDAAIGLASLSGTWQSSAGGTGTFTFTPGAAAPGYPRPVPLAPVPTAIRFQDDGALVAAAQGVGTIPAEGPGTRMMWYPGKAAFRAGAVGFDEWDDTNVGVGSVASGLSTLASGTGSAAFGVGSRATGEGSLASGSSSFALAPGAVAAGLATTANGIASVALGGGTAASGYGAVAIGDISIAAGAGALATGSNTSATGARSTAMGMNASTSQQAGSFVYGDASTSGSGGIVANDAPNQFMVRAAGGYKLFSNAARTTGVLLEPNASAWSSLSDRNSKHRFTDLDGDTVLDKLAAMPIQEWSYKAQDTVRHVGPTAQDFHAAFGLGEDPLRISTIDADGIALAAARALEARTRAQADELSALRAEVEALRRLVTGLTTSRR